MFQSVWSVGSGASLLVGLFCADRRSGFCGSRRPDRPKRNSAKSQGVFSHGGEANWGPAYTGMTRGRVQRSLGSRLRGNDT